MTDSNARNRGRIARVTIAPGVASLLASAQQTERLYKTLNGDLGQMASQKRYLEAHGINMGITGGIPGFYTEYDALRGLKLIWDNKFNGWRNYRHDFINLGICTEDELKAGLAKVR